MHIAYQIKKWDIRHPALFTVVRVTLGICLMIRGIYFLNHFILLQSAIETSSLNVLNIDVPLAMFIAWVHIMGGTFIVIGLLTSIAVWSQIPIVVGAIFFINSGNGLFTNYSDLAFAIFILLLLAVFAKGGSGKISMDHYLKKYLI